jgi:CRISPR system Cascade subunit CasD
MAVRVDSSGALLRDYHTVQVPPPDRGRRYASRKDELSVPKYAMNTILSQRDYRVDAHYTVAIYQNGGPYSLHELAEALKLPRYSLYLGRKSCPLAFPLQPTVVEVEHLKAAFDQMPVENELYSKEDLATTHINKQTAYYWEALTKEQTGLPVDGTYMLHERRDQLASRKRWQFVSRQEHQLLVTEGEKR